MRNVQRERGTPSVSRREALRRAGGWSCRKSVVSGWGLWSEEACVVRRLA